MGQTGTPRQKFCTHMESWDFFLQEFIKEGFVNIEESFDTILTININVPFPHRECVDKITHEGMGKAGLIDTSLHYRKESSFLYF